MAKNEAVSTAVDVAPTTPKVKKPRTMKPPAPTDLYVVVKDQATKDGILTITKSAEEAMEAMDGTPGATYKRVGVWTTNRRKPAAA